jgi:3-methylcrotonyl-CoA carboxylase alpha subunit
VQSVGAEEDASSESRILSPMPGRVALVSVVEGASVAKGDPLVTMEAMKMELSLTAPRDGKVASVTVVAGDQVNEGVLLVELEYDPEKWEPVFGEDHTQTKNRAGY